jgi:hypothetical protein
MGVNMKALLVILTLLLPISALGIFIVITPADVDVGSGHTTGIINPHSQSTIQVIIHGAENIDVNNITEVVFGLGEASPIEGKNKTRDVNKDGFADLVMHFKTRETGIRAGDVQACLGAMRTDGPLLEGCAEIRTVPANN